MTGSRVLCVRGRPVAGYADGAGLAPELAPRPYLHPVRTLGGVPLTDAFPDDHPWHLGFSVAVADVGGVNFWGGPDYMPGAGYRDRGGHGTIRSAGAEPGGHAGPGELDDHLDWTDPHGAVLLRERRRIRARPAPGGWELELRTALRNVSGRPLTLGSPATRGRTGAGYGGLFWRLAPAREPEVRTATASGERAVHGTVAPWLVWNDPAAGFGLALAGADPRTRADPWFVRLGEYPAVGSQLAARVPLAVPPDGTVVRGLRALVSDAPLTGRAVREWVGASAVGMGDTGR